MDAPQGVARRGRPRCGGGFAPESPTLALESFEIDAVKHHQVWVPPGFGHAALEDDTQLLYKCGGVQCSGQGNIHLVGPRH